jgi:hypothetical protein
MTLFFKGRMFALGALLFLLAVQPAKAQQKAACSWRKGPYRALALGELETIVAKHWEWVESFGQSGDQADLKGASLGSADLKNDELSQADLSGAYLWGAHLEGSTLSGADLKCAGLYGAQLEGANLTDADLSGANLGTAHMSKAELFRANLKEANLSMADLGGASLVGTNLTDVDLTMANLKGVVFETASNPEARFISLAYNLESMTYHLNPSGLTDLRKRFADGGFRDQERKITYALKQREAEDAWNRCKSRKVGDKTKAMVWSSDSNLANCGSFVLNRVFFDWTCQYGMSPGRPLSLGVLVWALCSILYFVFIHTAGEGGLYRVYAPGIKENPSEVRRVDRISASGKMHSRGWQSIFQFLRREWMVLRASMFSA